MYSPSPEAKILESPQNIQEMFAWAAQRNITWPKIAYPVLFPPGYIGSMALADIHPNERIITAPSSSVLTSQVARSCPDLKPIFEGDPELSNRGMLALLTFILWEKQKGEQSVWAPFLKSQPCDASNLQDWTDSELSELQDANLILDTKLRKEYHEYGWNYWKNSVEKTRIFSAEMLSLQEYTWAFRVVSTRCFGKFCPYITLFPVGELLNHNNVETFYIYQKPNETPDSSFRYEGQPADQDRDDELLSNDKLIENSSKSLLSHSVKLNGLQIPEDDLSVLYKYCDEFDALNYIPEPKPVSVEESDEKEISICAGPNEHYKAGSEVFMSYGRYSNRQLLSSYGFALNQNKFNYAQLRLNLSDLLFNPAPPSEFSTTIKLKNTPPDDLLQKIRSFNWTPSLPFTALLTKNEPVFEQRVAAKALQILESALKAFPTTQEEDQQILSSTQALRKYFAVIYRVQLKETLSAHISYIRQNFNPPP